MPASAARRSTLARSSASSPGGRGELAIQAAHERLLEALVDVRRLVGEAALVAEPAVVDVVVLAREGAQHALVTHRVGDVCTARGRSVQTVPHSMSHGRARKRYGRLVSAAEGHSSMMLPLNGATYGWLSNVPTYVSAPRFRKTSWWSSATSWLNRTAGQRA